MSAVASLPSRQPVGKLRSSCERHSTDRTDCRSEPSRSREDGERTRVSRRHRLAEPDPEGGWNFQRRRSKRGSNEGLSPSPIRERSRRRNNAKYRIRCGSAPVRELRSCLRHQPADSARSRARHEESVSEDWLDSNMPPIQWVAACRPHDAGGFPSIGSRGCFLSHLAVLEDASAKGFERILIVEDDVDFLKDFPESFRPWTRSERASRHSSTTCRPASSVRTSTSRAVRSRRSRPSSA